MYSNHGNFNTAIGDFALTLNDTATKTLPSTEPRSWRIRAVRLTRPIGDFAGDAQTTASRNVYIGALVGEIAGESDHTYIRHISSTTVNGETVTVDRVTQLLGHASSSRRYKEHIKPMDKASDALYRLKPVTLRL